MHTLNKGYLYLAWFLIIDSLFPIFSFFIMKEVPTLWVITFSVWVAMCFWLIIFFKKKLFRQYQNKEILIPTFLSALFLWMGSALYFFWIKYSSPSIAAILLLLQIFIAFIVFNIFWKESYNIKQVVWATLMLVWAVVTLYDWNWNFINIWAWIMVIAGIAWVIWNYYTKEASLKWANPFFLLMNRHILMLTVTCILALTFVWKPNLIIIKENFIWVFLIWFLVLLLWKSLWIMSLKNLSSFVAISAESTIIPLLVIVFSFFILNDIPSIQELIWFIPILIWALLLMKNHDNKID